MPVSIPDLKAHLFLFFSPHPLFTSSAAPCQPNSLELAVVSRVGRGGATTEVLLFVGICRGGGDMYPDGDALKPVGIKTAMCSNSQETHLAKQRTVGWNAPTRPF